MLRRNMKVANLPCTPPCSYSFDRPKQLQSREKASRLPSSTQSFIGPTHYSIMQFTGYQFQCSSLDINFRSQLHLCKNTMPTGHLLNMLEYVFVSVCMYVCFCWVHASSGNSLELQFERTTKQGLSKYPQSSTHYT